MSRWQPGAMVNVGGMRAFYTDGNEGPMFTFTDGSRARADVVPADPARPLVVIDAEDREQVKRLLATYHAQYPVSWSSDSDAIHANNMQAALREFANPQPPKPDEPTGLGAVVEDAEGKRYVRCAEGRERWHCPDDDTGNSDNYYAAIDAVRVLSEGVRP